MNPVARIGKGSFLVAFMITIFGIAYGTIGIILKFLAMVFRVLRLLVRNSFHAISELLGEEY